MATKEKSIASRLTVAIVVAIAFVCDVLTKNWARSSLIEATRQPFIPGFIQFCLTTNTGAAFSLGSSNSALMTALASIMTVTLILWAIKRELGSEPVDMLDRVGLGCIIGGAIGNLFDRFLRGRVTDFLDFAFVSFPVFNVADMLIDTGIGLLILRSLRHSPRQTAQNQQTESLTVNEQTTPDGPDNTNQTESPS